MVTMGLVDLHEVVFDLIEVLFVVEERVDSTAARRQETADRTSNDRDGQSATKGCKLVPSLLSSRSAVIFNSSKCVAKSFFVLE